MSQAATSISATPANQNDVTANNRTSTEVKTIFNILSKIKDQDTKFTHNSESKRFVTTETIQINSSLEADETDDIVILRRDPDSNRRSINKKAYVKLHRSLSPNRSSSVDRLKEKYEVNSSDNETVPEVLSKLDPKTIEVLKKKYSPEGLGYASKKTPAPVPKPRTKSQIITSSPPKEKRSDFKPRYSLNIDKSIKKKDENSNLVPKSRSNSDEFITIVKRSDSEESVDKFQKELSYFTMDKKKRSNSFRKLFSGKLFSSKDKKKKTEEKNKSQNKENGSFSENQQNENKNFTRHSSYRHTTGPGIPSNNSNLPNLKRSDSDNQMTNYNTQNQIEQDYAQKHINQFRQIQQNFNHINPKPEDRTPQGYVSMEKPLYKSNQSNQQPSRYMHLQNVQKYIDTSSSDSTAGSERANIYQNEVLAKNSTDLRRDTRRDTPPRAQETRTHVKLVSPKALIPINSERPLPNPYQNMQKLSPEEEKYTPKVNFSNTAKKHNEQKELERKLQQPYLEETYGTVFDNVELRRPFSPRTASLTLELQKPPRSPSLEPTKLKLPPNRDIGPLSPRVKSPIPHHHVSTEKLIATELLKPSRSPVAVRKNQREPSPSHQRLEIDIDYPVAPMKYNNDFGYPVVPTKHEAKQSNEPEYVMRKPPSGSKLPISRKSPEEGRNNYSRDSTSTLDQYNITQRMSQASLLDSSDSVINSPTFRTPTPNSLLQNPSLSPVRVSNVRPVTPNNPLIPPSPTSPQKEEMRKSVEAYYWKEIKKLKDQENYDYYIYQMQGMMPHGFAEDPVSARRSRSMSPNAQRNGRRSLSLPRETKPTNMVRDTPEIRRQLPIPEGRAVVNQRPPLYVQTQLPPQQFMRNTPERSTVDGSVRSMNTNSLYRPIFKRGSLNTPPRQVEESSLKRQVSFSNSRRPEGYNSHAWPTRNGFVASPPQRRIEKNTNLVDDVFLPNTPTQRGNETYGYVNVKPQRNSTNANDIVYYTRQNNEVVPQEVLYGQPIDAIRTPQGLTRHGSIQINEEMYRQRQLMNQQRQQEPQYVSRQVVQVPPKREVIINDEIFGQFGGYIPVNNEKRYVQNYQQQPNPLHSSRQSVAESIYGRSGSRQVLVHNKVCDMYGQIHDSDSKIQQSGVLMGQLHRSPESPLVARQSYTNLPNNNEQFARNTRLTASANDMYRRMQNDPRYVAQTRQIPTGYNTTHMRSESVTRDIANAPTRPLPPVPRKELLRGNLVGVSDTESGSDASEIQRILKNGGKNKKRGLFGK